MSERNVEVVRSLLEPFQAINTAEVDWGADVVRKALAAKCSPDIEIRDARAAIAAGAQSMDLSVEQIEAAGLTASGH